MSNNLSFMNAPQFFFTSESVTEGHPDKICDQVSDAILDAIIADDPDARVACECAVTTGLVAVMGEITTDTYVDMNRIVRDVVCDIGYTRAKFGFDCDTCGVIVSIKEQSADIALGVDKALEARTGEMSDEEIEAIEESLAAARHSPEPARRPPHPASARPGKTPPILPALENRDAPPVASCARHQPA